MINFLHSYSPEPVVFSVFGLPVHWYGLLMIIGGLFGFAIILFLATKFKQEKEYYYDLLLAFVVGAVIGARIYYVIYAWEFYRESWLDIFKIWQGGLAIHGIIIGGFISTYLFTRWKKKDFWLTADFAVVGLVAAQVIGRVGNYFNQEIFGKPTELSWGIPIDIINRPAEFLQYEFFHPTFLYESLGNLIILGLLLGLFWLRKINKKVLTGEIFLGYLFLYSVQRFALEFFRIDYSPLVFGIRWAQLFSGIIILLAISAIIWRRRTQKV